MDEGDVIGDGGLNNYLPDLSVDESTDRSRQLIVKQHRDFEPEVCNGPARIISPDYSIQTDWDAPLIAKNFAISQKISHILNEDWELSGRRWGSGLPESFCFSGLWELLDRPHPGNGHIVSSVGLTGPYDLDRSRSSGQPRRSNHQDAIQTGRLSTTAATAITTGPNSPAPKDANVVTAPSPIPAISEPCLRPCRQSRRQPSANGKPHTATGNSDTVRSSTLDSRLPRSGGRPEPGRNRTAACPAMQAGNHRTANAQKLRSFIVLRVFIPMACSGCVANSSEEPKRTSLGAAIMQPSRPR